MNRYFVGAMLALTMSSMTATSASAFDCVARSPNGARGAAYGLLILERAKSIALRRCIVAGGNLHGVFCHIEYCR
jgi:hypothetical protein